MKATLLRTGSNPVQNITRSTSGSPLPTGPIPSSPRISLRSHSTNGRFNTIRRSSSDTDMIRSEYSISRVGRIGSVSFADMGVVVEEEFKGGFGFGFGFGNGSGKGNYNFGGGGRNGGNNEFSNNNNNNNNNNEKSNKLKEYYLAMLRSNPSDPLLLRNYGKYLHEVEKDVEKAEEYYGRAILANPGDGELLSLYGNLIWETQRDEDRAQSYFDQALHASPQDCTVLGSYAYFLWEAEDEEVDSDGTKRGNAVVPAMVGTL